MKWILKLLKLPFSDYKLVFRIYSLLYISKWYIENRHLKNIVEWIGLKDASERPLTKKEMQTAWKVAHYTRTLTRLVPFKSKCYDKALTVKKILNQKNIPSALLMGVKTSEDNSMEAHAWVRCNQRLIIGGETAAEYTALKTFI